MKVLEKVRNYLLQLYLLLLLVGVPLFYVDTYIRIGTMKWLFYRAITMGTIWKGFYIPGVLVIVLLLNVLVDKTPKRKQINPFLIGYIVTVIISFFLMEDKTLGLEGYKGWYMGLLSQISFFVIYVATKGYYSDNKILRYAVLLSSCYTSFLVVLNRFGIYPFGISQMLEEGMLRTFVSTIGNINWYASYLMIFVGVAFGSYILAETKRNRIVFAIWCCLLYASLLLQNSESVFFSLFALFVGCLVISVYKKETFIRVIELMILMSISFLIVGCLYLIFPTQAMSLEELPNMFKNPLLNVFIIIICLVIRKYIQTMNWDVQKMRRIIFWSVFGVIIIILVILKMMNSSFVVFDDAWGSHRGMVWRVTIESWLELWKNNPIKAIFGVGPDAYASYVYSMHSETLSSYFYTQVVTNAHNEWLTAFINYGLVGGLSYLLFFLSRLRNAINNHQIKKILVIEFCIILAYMTNNFFSFQSIVSTPLLFALMGIFDHAQGN